MRSNESRVDIGMGIGYENAVAGQSSMFVVGKSMKRLKQKRSRASERERSSDRRLLQYKYEQR